MSYPTDKPSALRYVLGLPTNAVRRADPEIVKVADACAVKRAEEQHPVLRNYAGTRYGAKSCACEGKRSMPRILNET